MITHYQCAPLQVEAVQNHTPEVIVVDELGGQKEVAACQSIGERGVQLIATVHGNTIEDVMDNPEFMGGIGDIDSVIIGDDEAHRRARDGCNIVKTVRERKRKPTFDVLVEIRQQDCWVVHEVKTSVDALLQGHASDVMVSACLLDKSARLAEVFILYSLLLYSPFDFIAFVSMLGKLS